MPLLLLLFVVACTSDSPDADGSPQDNGGATDDALMALFSQMPDEPEVRSYVQFSVPGRAAQQLDIPVPALDADHEEFLDYSAALLGSTRTSLQQGGESGPGETRGEVPGPAWPVCTTFRSNGGEGPCESSWGSLRPRSTG